ncbi:amino acid ABC transporter permease [Alkaliphilus pronyensis]|uniref:Amino acid ABC transporter permease n=1 Tax=Alkaliphilus pronyensis TaxID=1482732 RepID=A0A6I0F8H5_9FIRM|nr:amino acid ABC transporter permease [Alkaliphilus pronyensis]KAB3539020.1 amino acid ABC transporter permease [Alkaliphilus pronyensis]
MDFSFMHKYYQFYIDGTVITLLLSFFGVLCGVVLGVFLALMKLSRNSMLKLLASAYIELVRGTPLLVQLYIVYYGLPKLLGWDFADLTLGIVAVSLNSAAYVAEIIRAGIQSVDKGQMEAARSLGMPHRTAMTYIIIPQAIKNILPALGNEFIVLIKESAIVSVVGIHDLMYKADTVRGNTYRPFAPLLVAAAIYFTIIFGLSKLLAYVEGRMRTGDSSI